MTAQLLVACPQAAARTHSFLRSVHSALCLVCAHRVPVSHCIHLVCREEDGCEGWEPRGKGPKRQARAVHPVVLPPGGIEALNEALLVAASAGKARQVRRRPSGLQPLAVNRICFYPRGPSAHARTHAPAHPPSSFLYCP
jgi:hypothetical protein